MIKSYSNFNGPETSLTELSLKFNIPKVVLSEIFSILGINHDSLPISNEDLLEKKEDKLIEEIIQDKKFNLFQSLQKRDWIETQSAAKNWYNYKNGTVNPIEQFLSTWNPPKYKVSNKKSEDGDLVFLCGLNDVHLGEHSNENTLFSGRSYNSEIAVKNIEGYASRIKVDIDNRREKFSHCELALNGDFLNSCMGGKTAKGTQLENDLVDIPMFELGLNVLISFVGSLKNIFGKVNIRISDGNHESIILSYLSRAASIYFKDDPNIVFFLTEKWASLFRINNVAVIMCHGGSPNYKTSVPKSAPALKSYMQDMFLAKSNELGGVTQKIAIVGHLHSFWQQDLGGIEFFRFGAPVLGGNYEDAFNFRSAPRQNCLIIGQDYVKETLHYFF